MMEKTSIPWRFFTNLPVHIHNILVWASLEHAEDHRFIRHEFLITKPIENVWFRIQSFPSQLFALIGLSGIGKSETLIFLRDQMNAKYREADRNEPEERKRYNVSFKWQIGIPLWDILQDDMGARLQKKYKMSELFGIRLGKKNVQTFNMGAGMVLVLYSKDVPRALTLFEKMTRESIDYRSS